jgi:DNA-binding PadR family transcriptional regulator
MDEVRITLAVAAVLRIFLDDIHRPQYGYDLMRQTGFASGKLYPLLARLEGAGWLVKDVEEIDPVVTGRPARRMYRLSARGVPAAQEALAAVKDQLRGREPGPAARRLGVEPA